MVAWVVVRKKQAGTTLTVQGPTFVDVSEHMQLGLHSPLHRVEELHAPHPLHLPRDPVQKPCPREEPVNVLPHP